MEAIKFKDKYDEYELIKKIILENGKIKQENLTIKCNCNSIIKIKSKIFIKNYLKKGFVELDCPCGKETNFSIHEALNKMTNFKTCNECGAKIPKVTFTIKKLEIKYFEIHEYFEHNKISKIIKELIKVF